MKNLFMSGLEIQQEKMQAAEGKQWIKKRQSERGVGRNNLSDLGQDHV